MMMNRAVDWYGLLVLNGILYSTIVFFFDFQGQLQKGVYGRDGEYDQRDIFQSPNFSLSFTSSFPATPFQTFCFEKETRNLAMLLSILSLQPGTGGSFSFSTSSSTSSSFKTLLTFQEVMSMLKEDQQSSNQIVSSHEPIRNRLLLEILFVKNLIVKQTGTAMTPLLFFAQNADHHLLKTVSVIKPFIHSLHGYTSKGVKIDPEVFEAYSLFIKEMV